MTRVQDDTVDNNQPDDLNEGTQEWLAPDFTKERISNTQASFGGMGADSGIYS